MARAARAARPRDCERRRPGRPARRPAAAPGDGDGDDDDFSALAAKARLAHGGGGGDTPASRGSPTSDFSWVELRLDASLSCRFCPATGELRVPFCTGGVRYEFRRAPNAQRPVWDASDPFLRGVADLADAGSPSARRAKPLPALPPGVTGISGIGDVLDSMLPDLSQLSYGGLGARARGAPSTQRLAGRWSFEWYDFTKAPDSCSGLRHPQSRYGGGYGRFADLADRVLEARGGGR